MEGEVEDSERQDEGDDEGGCFLLESLGTLDTVTIESSENAQSGDTPRAIVRPKVVQVNTTKALREIQENQKRMEKKIATLTVAILVSLAIGVIATQTNVLENGVEGIRAHAAMAAKPAQPLNCSLAENKSQDECVVKKLRANSSFEGIGRSPNGQVSHFSLNGM